MDPTAVIASLLALSGTHAGGHLNRAGQYGFNPSLDLATFTERWADPRKDNPAYDPAKEIAVHGAGFEAQDTLNRAIDTPESNASNALYKALYSLGLTMGKGMTYKGGDIEAIEKLSGNKYTKQMIQASAVANALGIPLDFTMIEGGKGVGPGLVYRKRF